jgi:hypothetical protein
MNKKRIDCFESKEDGYMEIVVPKEMVGEFQHMLFRAINTWQDPTPEMRDFIYRATNPGYWARKEALKVVENANLNPNEWIVVPPGDPKYVEFVGRTMEDKFKVLYEAFINAGKRKKDNGQT